MDRLLRGLPAALFFAASACSGAAPAPEPEDPDPAWQRNPGARECRLDPGADFDAETIQACIDANLGPLTDCYVGALRRDRDARGTLHLTFEVEASGRIGAVDVALTGFDDPEMLVCAESAVATWWFPEREPGARTARVERYPVELEAR